MEKYYFEDENSEMAHNEIHFKDIMIKNNVTELDVFEAITDKVKGAFWCREFEDICEVGESCGKQCNMYSPRNSKNGRCRHSGYVYEPSGKTKILKR